MLKEAKALGLDLPYEFSFIKKIIEKREAKLKKLESDDHSPLSLLNFPSLKVITN